MSFYLSLRLKCWTLPPDLLLYPVIENTANPNTTSQLCCRCMSAKSIHMRHLCILHLYLTQSDCAEFETTPTIRAAALRLVGSGMFVMMRAMVDTVFPKPWSSARMPPLGVLPISRFSIQARDIF